MKWATKNLGATNPEDYGNLYSWGNPTGSNGDIITSPGFTSDNYQDPGKSISKAADWDKTKHDAAYKENNAWRMPTKDDFKELFKQCYAEWGTYNSVYGLIVYKAREGDAGYAYFNSQMNEYSSSENKWNSSTKTKPSYSTASDTFVFFPAAGYSMGTSRSMDGGYGSYWSSTLNSEEGAKAFRLTFTSSSVGPQVSSSRYIGGSVRPVSD